jgi:hypothetical protein
VDKALFLFQCNLKPATMCVDDLCTCGGVALLLKPSGLLVLYRSSALSFLKPSPTLVGQQLSLKLGPYLIIKHPFYPCDHGISGIHHLGLVPWTVVVCKKTRSLRMCFLQLQIEDAVVSASIRTSPSSSHDLPRYQFAVPPPARSMLRIAPTPYR